MPLPSPESKRTAHIFTVVTLVVSVACLAWALQGVSWTELWEDIRELDWRWVTVAAVADLLIYVVQGWRWSLLLLPVAPVSPWASVGAIYVGLFANEVLPLHAGELIRCFLMARWSKIPISVTLASALIERIFDGVLLIAGLFLSLRYIRHFPLEQRPRSGPSGSSLRAASSSRSCCSFARRCWPWRCTGESRRSTRC